jgi:hypothetical protein
MIGIVLIINKCRLKTGNKRIQIGKSLAEGGLGGPEEFLGTF